jgi:hypothetical protein
MAYTAFNASEIASEEPVKTELFGKVKDNFDNHETRIATLEATGLTIPPLLFVVKGAQYGWGTGTGVAYRRVMYDLTLTTGKLWIIDAGTSGTLEIDIQYKRGAGAFATIFSTRPSVAFGAGDYSISTNGVLSVTSLLTADVLRLDVTGIMTGNDEFQVFLEHEVA